VPADDGLRLHDDKNAQRGQQRRRVVQKNLSSRLTIGRGRLRLSTATYCRRARTSRAVSRRLRK
jgi:hypothetical protein